ncbi:hypothetical protein DL771_009957 [Monosporascus sp. 5C6A]|nr:hypothetical protein DL771_009957 [Monosporascus sp. 5C6A]
MRQPSSRSIHRPLTPPSSSLKRKDLEAQSIKSASYDIFVATDLKYSQATVLPKLRKALKAGGLTTWNSQATSLALSEMGFGGFDWVINNSAGVGMGHDTAPVESRQHSTSSKTPQIQIVYRKYACDVSAIIRSTFEAISWQVKLRKLNDCTTTVGADHIIMLDDMDNPLLLTITETEFEALKNIVQSTSSVLWITPASLLKAQLPDYAMTSGLVRTITSEHASVDFRMLDLEFETCPPEKIVDTIKRIVSQQILQEGVPEHEYCMSGGQLYISRLVRNQGLNSVFGPSRQTESKAVGPEDRITGVTLKGKVAFQQQISDQEEAVKPGHVEVQVHYSSLTKESVRVITGTDYPTNFSHEVGGVVKKVGPDVTGLASGDWVVGFNADKFATYQQIPVAMLQKLEDEADMFEAVSLLMPYATALHGLETLAGVQSNEHVLILHGTGTSGAAAVKIIDMYRRDLLVAPGVLEHIRLSAIDRAVSNFSDAFGAVKPVVQYTGSESTVVEALSSRKPLKFDPEATYLLVGCLGGLGRSLTSWMMKSGARRFSFLSRSGTDAPSAAKLVSDIESAGDIVQIVRGDVASADDVARAVRGVPPGQPIKGVVHAAMVLRDGLFHSMPFENWKTSTDPKVRGAANLHAALGNTPLDFFIMTSSVSGTLGTPGQGNYAAANSYLDALALHRRAAGQVATSIILPMVLGVGVIAENTKLEDSLKQKGMYGIDEEQLLEAFEAAIVSQSQQHVPSHVVVGLDPYKLQKAAKNAEVSSSFWMEDVRFNHVVHDMESSADDAAGSPAEAMGAVTEHFTGKLARMLMLSPDDFEADIKSVADYGIDSMIGAELRNWIFKEYRLDIPFQQLLAPTLTIGNFAKQVCSAAGVSAEE